MLDQDNNRNWLLTDFACQVANHFILFIIPVAIIFQLENIDTVRKIGAAAMFSVGLLNVALNVAASVLVYDGNLNPDY